MTIIKRIKERILGSEGSRALHRAIRRERATLRRWSERASEDRFAV